MAKGQTFTVPAEAQGPRIWTGRPNALAITVGGRTVPMLGTSEVVMKDVPIDAASLLGGPRRRRPPGLTPARHRKTAFILSTAWRPSHSMAVYIGADPCECWTCSAQPRVRGGWAGPRAGSLARYAQSEDEARYAR